MTPPEDQEPRPDAARIDVAHQRVAAVDGLRAFAILGVVTVHLLGASGVFAKTDGTAAGVALWAIFGNSIDAFFIISGFVLFLPVIRRSGEFGSKRSFWVGRGARLLPAFWLVLALIVVLVKVKPPSPGYAFPTAAEIGVHIPVMQMPVQLFDSGFRIGFGIDGPLWMISIVVTFYLLLPFVARGWYRHPLIGLAAAAAVTIVWKQAIAWTPGVFDAVSNGTSEFARAIAVDEFPGWTFSFGLGMTGAWAYVQAKRRTPEAELRRRALIAAPLVLLAYGFAAWQFGRFALTESGNIGPYARAETFQALLHSTLRAALMGIVILGPLWMQRPFVNRATRKLAELSYGIYLIHWVLVTYAVAFLDMPRDGTLVALAAWFALILPPACVYAALSRRFVEIPARNRIERRFRRSRAGAAASESPARP